jgi:hypothetical protein
MNAIVAVLLALVMSFGEIQSFGGVGERGEVLANCFSTKPCTAEVVSGGDGDWVVQVVSSADGKGSNPWCEPCKNCRATIKATFTGTGSWGWSDQSMHGGSGTGPTTLEWPLSTKCDGSPELLYLDTPDTGGLLVVGLYCTCDI